MRVLSVIILTMLFTTAAISQTNKVGINISNPQNTLHLNVYDTEPVGIQFTNKAIGEVPSFRLNSSTIGQSVNASSAGPWIGNANAANSPDGNYFEGPSASTSPSDYLQISFNFANPIPLDATITGYQVFITRRSVSSSSITDETIQLVFGSTPQGENKAKPGSWPSTGFSQTSYGGSTDKWGTNPITPGYINAGNLKIRIQFDSPIFSTASARVDAASIRVYYTFPAETTSHWVAGSADGIFKINDTPDLSLAAPFEIDDTGNTELQGLILSNGAATGKVLTSDINGNATWQDLPADLVDDADSDPNNEIQNLNLNGNTLEITSGSSADLSTFLDNTDDWNNGSGTIYHDSGDVGIGKNAPTYQLDVEDDASNDVIARFVNTNADADADGLVIGLGPASAPTAANQYINFLSGNGTIVGSISGNASGNISFNTTSDRRLKMNIQDYNEGLSSVLAIHPVKYEFINNPGQAQIGFIAQDLYEIIPSSVVGTPESPINTPMMVDYSKLTPILVSAIKEQQEIIDRLQKNQNDIIKELKSLKNQMKNTSKTNSSDGTNR